MTPQSIESHTLVRFPIQPDGDHEVDGGQLALCLVGSKGAGDKFSPHVTPMEAKRLATSQQTTFKSMMASTSMEMLMQRMVPRGQPHDSVEKFKWAPESWVAGGDEPEALRSLGAPWLLTGRPGSARHGDGEMPLMGVGQLLPTYSGPDSAARLGK